MVWSRKGKWGRGVVADRYMLVVAFAGLHVQVDHTWGLPRSLHLWWRYRGVHIFGPLRWRLDRIEPGDLR